MAFISPLFLFLFLPITLASYWLVGPRLRNLFLLGASILFYSWGEGSFIFLLFFSIIVNYIFGILAARYRDFSSGKIVIWFALAVNLGMLVWYKYAGFIVGTINQIFSLYGIIPLQFHQQQLLPLGISFFTFQAIAYILDVYRDEVVPEDNFIRFALFMSLFPKISAGPIIRYEEVSSDLPLRRIDGELIASGIQRFIVGLGKKVLIADTIAKTTEQIFAIPFQSMTAGVAWLGIICYSLQLYFDFSGYSDMAIGLCRMFGFKIRENFNYPYVARSLTEFWRRWHISLSTWFRDYLFIPLSYALMTDKVRKKIVAGSYKTNYRSLFTIIVVFTLCGLWHGAGYNFIIWGMLHGTVLAVESLWLGKIIKSWKIPFQHVYLLTVVMMAWVLFRVPELTTSLLYFKALAGLNAVDGLNYHLSLYLNMELLVVLLAGIAGAMPLARVSAEYVVKLSTPRLYLLAETAGTVLILVASCVTLSGSTYSAFIYRQF